MRDSTSPTALLAVAAVLMAVTAGCRSTSSPIVRARPCPTTVTEPASGWPATVTGCWLQPGVDTWAEFHLLQQGTTASGTLEFCGAIVGCAGPQEVSGSVALPKVLLHWTERSGQTYDYTFDATMSASADTLTGAITANGQPSGPDNPFRRVSAE